MVRLWVVFNPEASASVEPHSGEPRRLRTGNVSKWVVSYVPYLLGFDGKFSQRTLENRGVGLRDADFSRDDYGVEGSFDAKHPKACTLSIRGAIRHQRKRITPA